MIETPPRPILPERHSPLATNAPLALRILGGSAVLGVLGDFLLRPTPWGISLVLWFGCLVGVAAWVLHWRRLHASRDGRVLIGAALGFALLLAVRDSGTLRALNLLACVSALAIGLAALRTWRGQLRVASLSDYALTTLFAVVHAVAGATPLVLRETGWRRLPGGRWWTAGIGIGRGILLAVPVLLVFGGLFMSADAVFADAVFRALDWDLGNAIDHSFTIGALSWIVAGTLRAVTLESEPAAARTERRLSLGFMELATLMALLDALFLAFVLVQVRYLFGGAAQVSTATGLTYAEYARRGFFELVTVVALALPLLLTAHSLLRAANPTQERAFRWLSGVLVVLLFVIMGSAVQRMRLYQEVYGLTELRLYTTAFMGWLGVLLAWFAATVLRGRRWRFAFGALVSGLSAVVLLNAIDPDALIVRANSEQTNFVGAGSGWASGLGRSREMDAFYLATLSADAVPALVDTLPHLPLERQQETARALLIRWSSLEFADWRTWSWSRARAWSVIAHNLTILTQLATG